MDPAAAVRTYKKGMREDKNTKIDHADLLNRVKFAQESHNGFKVAGVDVRNGKGELVGRVPERTVPVSDVLEAAVKAARGALHDQAVQTVNRKNVFDGLFPGRMIDESRTEAAKGERRSLVAGHAYGIIKGHMGADDPPRLPAFAGTLQAIQNKPGGQQKILANMVKQDPPMGSAYQLFRDMGTTGSEAYGHMMRTMEIAVEKSVSADPTTARLAGIEGKDFAKVEKDEIVKPLADAGKRR